MRRLLAFLAATAIAAAVGIAPFLPAKPQAQARPPRGIRPPALGTVTFTSTPECATNGCGPHMLWHPAHAPGEAVMSGTLPDGRGWKLTAK